MSDTFTDILAEMQALHDLKAKDYGTDEDPLANIRGVQACGITPLLGVIIRLNDKMKRLQAFAKKGSLANESVEDTFRDMAVYSIIALQLMREKS